jgi:hypothetical protein
MKIFFIKNNLCNNINYKNNLIIQEFFKGNNNNILIYLEIHSVFFKTN